MILFKDYKRFYSPAGNTTRPTYQKITKNGKKVLEKTGETDIVEYIQASADEVDLLKIYERCRAGDFTALNLDKQPIYGDFTNLPKSINEFNMLQANAEKTFYQLPLEVRNEFNNNYEEYLEEMSNGSAKSKLEKYFKTDEKVVNVSGAPETQTNQSTGELKYE